MPLAAGTRIGPYEIVGALGAGGMGEVYRARDARLGREVAIKVLPPSVAADANRLARFEQEARAAAALDHPNILAVHDVGTDGSTTYLVSELLAGATLRTVLATPLPLKKCIDYGTQIANGLAAAHQKGIVHRDLKPDNVFVTSDGRVKILDFGLAKVTEPAAGGFQAGSVPTMLPTEHVTSPGTVLGTVGYMSPEQLRGLAVDARSDLFSLGCMLYEMVVGARPFRGESAADTITAILTTDPGEMTLARPDLPPALARVVAHCLEKNPAERFQSAHDVAFALSSISSVAAPTDGLPTLKARRPWPIRELIAWTIAIGAAAAAIAVQWRSDTVRVPTGAIRFSIAPPDGLVFHRTPSVPEIALSPDGRTLAFVALSGPASRSLWMRRFDTATAIRLAADAYFPFWSPDGRYVAFWSRNRMWRVAAAEGATPEPVAEAIGSPHGGSWSSSGTAILATVGGDRAMSEVTMSGASRTKPLPQIAAPLANGNFASWLPDGRHILFVNATSDSNSGGLYVANAEGPPASVKRLLPATERAEYSCGHILAIREGALLAYPFDLRSLTISGDPQKVADGVGENPPYVSLATSNNSCTIAFGGQHASSLSHLSWVDRGGHAAGEIGAAGQYADVRLSPDGTRVAIKQFKSLADQTGWIIDLTRGVSTKITSAQGGFPVWLPGVRRLLWSSYDVRSFARGDLQAISTDGTGKPEVIAAGGNLLATDLTPDARAAVVTMRKQGDVGDFDIDVISMTGDRKVQPYLTSTSNEYDGRLSPDGKWLAYVSDESGADEVYVHSFPQQGHKYRISTDGGTEPKWRGDGREVFYRSNASLMAVAIRSVGADLEPGVPLEILRGMNWALRGSRAQEFNWSYDVTRNGQRFIVNQFVSAVAPLQVHVIVDWPGLLR